MYARPQHHVQPKRTRELLTFVSNNKSIHNERLTASQVVLYATHTRLSLHIAANAQWRRQAWGTGARAPLEFANSRKFCRPKVRWLSLLDDFVTTNFETRAPRAHAPPLEQNSGDATACDREPNGCF